VYKPMAKASGAQRESEGGIVPLMAVLQNTDGGKAPCFGDASDGGKSEGMVRTAVSKYPGGRKPIDKVRRLQRKLYVAAKRDRRRRFHALYDRIHRSDVLWEAWRRVRARKGAGGVDGITLQAVEEYGVARLLVELGDRLRAGQYRPPPVLRRYIPRLVLGSRSAPTPWHCALSEPVHAAFMNTIVKPCAGNPHARFERRRVETGR